MRSAWMRVMELAFGLLNEIDLALNEVDEEPPITEDGHPNIDDDHPDAIWGFSDQDIGDVIHENTTFHIIDICVGCGEIEEACACYEKMGVYALLADSFFFSTPQIRLV